MNLIEGLASEHEMEIEYESDREFELESDDFNLDQIIESTVEWATDAAPIPVSYTHLTLPTKRIV